MGSERTVTNSSQTVTGTATYEGVDAIDKSDGGTGANGITKVAVEAVTIEEAEIYGELVVEEIEGASAEAGGQLTLPFE